MRRLCALAVIALAVPFMSADNASATDVTRVGDVTAVSVMPAAGRANVLIAVSGETKVLDFTLDNPNRIVLDVSPARLSSVPAYDKIPRGGIANIRFTQYDQNVVRVVLDLDKQRPYEMTNIDGVIRVSVQSDGNEFDQWSSRKAANAVAVAPTLVIPSTTTDSASQVQRITVSYAGDDIKVVVAGFAMFSGRTILINDKVTGNVTGTINDQPWDTALRALLDVNGFAMTVEPDGIIKVDTYANIFARQQTERLTTTTVNVNYTRAKDLAETLRGLLYRDCSSGQTGLPTSAPAQTGSLIGQPSVPPGCQVRGSVMADTLSSKLVITEVSSHMDDLLRFVQDLDVRTRQVSIKAEIYVVNRTSIEDIGVSYDIGTANQFFNSKVQRIDPTTTTPVDINGDGVPDFMGGGTAFPSSTNVVNLGGNALSAVSNASTRVLNPALQLIYSMALGKFDLTTFLDLLQETRLADVQASPTVTTADNHEATIFMGEETPIRSVQPQAGNNTAVVTLVQFKTTGITLRVTPHITSNRQVIMQISAERSAPEAGTSDIGLIFTKQTSNNSLLVADGETAVIGGITTKSVSVSKVGIPILVDLPFIGKLFGQTTTREEKRELLILVTPHIIDDGAGGPGGDL